MTVVAEWDCAKERRDGDVPQWDNDIGLIGALEPCGSQQLSLQKHERESYYFERRCMAS